MPTPSAPVSLINKHLTKAEKDQREQAEKKLITGQAIKEWPQTRAHPIAHKRFRRIVSLYRTIGKNDALAEPVLNRYCMLQAECYDFEAKREDVYTTTVKLREMLDQTGEDCDIDTLREVSGKINDLYKSMVAIDRQIQAKRKMLLDIERESLMTLAAQMRSIPKKVAEAEPSPMAEFLRKRAEAK